MSTSDLGTKQLCPNCEAKFYDLNKRPAVCPKCQNSFEPDAEEVIAARTKVAGKAATSAAKETDDDEDDEEAEEAKAADTDEDEDEDEDETIAELGDDDDPALALNDSEDDDEETTPKGVPAGFSEQGVDDDDILDDEAEEFDIDVDVDVDVDGDDDEDDLPGE